MNTQKWRIYSLPVEQGVRRNPMFSVRQPGCTSSPLSPCQRYHLDCSEWFVFENAVAYVGNQVERARIRKLAQAAARRRDGL